MTQAVFCYKILGAMAASFDGMDDVIKEVQFSIVASDGVNEVSSFFPVVLDDPSPDSFISYKNITVDQVIAWCAAKVGDRMIESLKNGLQARFDEMSSGSSHRVLRPIDLSSK